MQAVLVFCVVFIALLSLKSSIAVEITLKNGKIECTEATVLDKKVTVCRGVPYAKPPVGPLRFKKPEPIGNWEGVKKAVENPKLCKQIDPSSVMKSKEAKDKMGAFDIEKEIENLKKEKPVVGGALGMALEFKGLPDSEDCLYLNMFFVKDCKPGEKLAPVVFFHGGFFYAGGVGTKTFDGSYLAAHGCLLVVTPQYRLNVYGFLNSGTPDIPGNQGLYDQMAALQFVKDNAESLGADPNLLTPYGFDAGGWSVGLCLLSPHCSKLFKRAIMSSGGPLNTLMLFGESASIARFQKFCVAANCPLPKKKDNEDFSKPDKATIECLQKMTPQQINEAHTKVLSSKKDIPFFPNEDTAFLGGNPFDTVKKIKYENVNEILLTSNSNEAGLMISCAMHQFYPPLKGEPKPATLDELVSEAKKNGGSGGEASQMQMMLPMFFRNTNKNDPVAVRNRCLHLATDGMYTCLDLMFISAFCKNKHKNVYYLRFDYRPSKSYFAKWMDGSQHADELQYVWGLPFHPEYKGHYNDHEKDISAKVMTFFANFAKHGNPSKGTKIDWHPMHDKKRSYMLINEKEIKEHKGVPKNTCKDLNRYYGMGRSFLKNYKA